MCFRRLRVRPLNLTARREFKQRQITEEYNIEGMYSDGENDFERQLANGSD